MLVRTRETMHREVEIVEDGKDGGPDKPGLLHREPAKENAVSANSAVHVGQDADHLHRNRRDVQRVFREAEFERLTALAGMLGPAGRGGLNGDRRHMDVDSARCWGWLVATVIIDLLLVLMHREP